MEDKEYKVGEYRAFICENCTAFLCGYHYTDNMGNIEIDTSTTVDKDPTIYEGNKRYIKCEECNHKNLFG